MLLFKILLLHLVNKKVKIMNYGTIIKKLRVDKMKQTQASFANSLGITQTYLSQIENNNKSPSSDLMNNISEYVKIPLAVIYWLSLTINDVPEHKREYFLNLKPTADSLINSFFI